MLVMKLNKALNTDECIEYSKMISEYLGERVIILDKYADNIYRMGNDKFTDYNLSDKEKEKLIFKEKFVSFLINEGNGIRKITIDEILEYEKDGYQIEIKMIKGKDIIELAIETETNLEVK